MDCHVFDEASAILRTSRNRARVSQRMVEMVGRHSVADSAQKQTTAATRYTATGAVWRRANGDAEAAQRRVCGRSVRVHSAVVGSCSRTRLHASHGGCMRCKWACGAGAGAGTEWCLSKSDGGWAGGVVWCGSGSGRGGGSGSGSGSGSGGGDDGDGDGDGDSGSSSSSSGSGGGSGT